MRYTTIEVVLVLACGLVLGAIAFSGNDKPADAEDAVRLCEETGGQLLVTEYNTVTGLTLNCFYEMEEVGINPEPDSIAL